MSCSDQRQDLMSWSIIQARCRVSSSSSLCTFTRWVNLSMLWTILLILCMVTYHEYVRGIRICQPIQPMQTSPTSQIFLSIYQILKQERKRLDLLTDEVLLSRYANFTGQIADSLPLDLRSSRSLERKWIGTTPDLSVGNQKFLASREILRWTMTRKRIASCTQWGYKRRLLPCRKICNAQY